MTDRNFALDSSFSSGIILEDFADGSSNSLASDGASTPLNNSEGGLTPGSLSSGNSLYGLDLSPGDLSTLHEFLRVSNLSEGEKLDLLRYIRALNPVLLRDLIIVLRQSPELSPQALVGFLDALTNVSGAGNFDDLQVKILKLGPATLKSILALVEQNPSNAQKIIDAISTLDPKDSNSLALFSKLIIDLEKSNAGETITPKDYAEIIETYSNSPDPFLAIASDVNILQTLNTAHEGSGQFGVIQLHKLGLSVTAGGDTDKKVQEAAEGLKAVSNYPEFDSTDKIMNFVNAYLAAGGSDVPTFLSQLDQINDGIKKIKAALGYASTDSLMPGYESYLLSSLVKAYVQGNIDEVIVAEQNKIGEVFPDSDLPLNSADAGSYQVMGYKANTSDDPFVGHNASGLQTPKFTYYESTAPHPYSALNSDSTHQFPGTKIHFKSLSEYGSPPYTDISESPLYSEAVLQEEFDGNVGEYAEYLAIAHFLMEEVLHVTPDMYDGYDEITLEQVQGYLRAVGYDPGTLHSEMNFILMTEFDLNSLAPEGALEGTYEVFDPSLYIRTGGRAYEDVLGLNAVRPDIAQPMFFTWPNQFMGSTKAMYAVVETDVVNATTAVGYHDKAITAQAEKSSLVGKYAGQSTDPGHKVTVADEDKDKFRSVRTEELMYLNLSEAMAAPLTDEEKARYINPDGTNVLVYNSETGLPLKNFQGADMTLREYEAILKFVPQEKLGLVLIDQEGAKVNGESIITSNPTTEQLAEYYVALGRTEPLKSPFPPDPEVTIADLQYPRFAAEGESRNQKMTELTNSFTQATEKLTGFKSWWTAVRDILIASMKNQVDTLVATTTNWP